MTGTAAPFSKALTMPFRSLRRPLPPLAALLLLATALAGCAGSSGSAPDAEILINPRLSPDYSQWLVGPTGRMATAEEVQAFLALSSDAEAAAFVEEFWERRDPMPLRADNPLRETYEERAAVADRQFSEAGYLGRRTDRGTIFVLHGEPSEIDYQNSPSPDDPPVEVWIYPADAPPGLTGRPPERFYKFIRRGDLTRFYTPPSRIDPRPRRPGEPGYVP